MNETVEKLQNYIIDQMQHARGKQWKLDVDNDMFHFYGGMVMALKDVLDELCKLEGIRKENERKEMK